MKEAEEKVKENEWNRKKKIIENERDRGEKMREKEREWMRWWRIGKWIKETEGKMKDNERDKDKMERRRRMN